MISLVEQRARDARRANVRADVRDFVEHGTRVPDGSLSHVMAFNQLHIEDPLVLLREAHRILQPGGSLSAIHGRSAPYHYGLPVSPTADVLRG